MFQKFYLTTFTFNEHTSYSLSPGIKLDILSIIRDFIDHFALDKIFVNFEIWNKHIFHVDIYSQLWVRMLNSSSRTIPVVIL